VRIVKAVGLAALYLSCAMAHADQCDDLIERWNRPNDIKSPPLPQGHDMSGSCQDNAAWCGYARAQLDYSRRLLASGQRKLAMVGPMFNACAAHARVLVHTWGAPTASPGARALTRSEAKESARQSLADWQRDVDHWEAQVAHDCDPKRLTTACFDDAGSL